MGWKETLSAWWDDIRRKRRVSVSQIENEIDKSPEDKRCYRGLLLNNGMKVLLISDPSTDKAAAALDVHVGHTSDPDEYPGLAHLCEHMLFMGTKESREANDYKRFLCEHGGSSNAYTSIQHTNYHFDVAADHLEEALSRFSKFIKNPSFSPLVVEREINVVSAEHEKNKYNDQWRLFQLNKSTANPEHPYSKFGTGNVESLKSGTKDDITRVFKELVNFHKAFYSANIMCLVVIGKETLDSLEDTVIPLFSCIRNTDVLLSPTDVPPYGPNEVKVQMQVVPIKDMQNMLLTWPIDDLLPLYRVKPAHYIGHCISFQGPGSVFAELKRKGWINSFAAAQKFGGKGYMFFCISMDLTDDGFNNTDAIILMIFQFLNLIRTIGPQEDVYQECSDIKSLRFRYKDKEPPRDYASDCSELLHEFPFKDVLTGPWLMMEFQPKIISDILSRLAPNTIRVTIRSRKFSGETNHVEKWYGTEYSIHPIPGTTLQDWHEAGINEHFHLPPKNEFIPANLALVERDHNCTEFPVLLEDSPMLKLWHKQDDEFLLPKTYITMLFTSHLGPDSAFLAVCYDLVGWFLRDYLGEEIVEALFSKATFIAHKNPREEMRGDLMVDLLNDHLEEVSYPAQLAGSTFDIFCSSRGITVTIQGFSEKIEVLLIRILERIVRFELEKTRFHAIKNRYVKMLSNFNREPPFKQAKYLINCILSTRVWTRAQLLEEAKGVSLDQVQTFLSEMLSKVHIEVLTYGNISSALSQMYAQIVKDTLLSKMASEHLESPSSYRPEEIQLLAGHLTYYEHIIDSSKGSPNAVVIQWQCGPESTVINALSELFVHLINQRAYDVIRTQKQLGYIVICDVRSSRAVRGVRLVVQSHLSSQALAAHLLEFMKDIWAFLENMSQDTFGKHRDSLKLLKTEKPKRLMDQSAQYWREISTRKYQFDRQKVEASFLDGVSQNDVIDFYKRYFLPGSSEYRILTVHVQGPSLQADDEKVTLNSFVSSPIIKVDDIESFKMGSKLWS